MNSQSFIVLKFAHVLTQHGNLIDFPPSLNKIINTHPILFHITHYLIKWNTSKNWSTGALSCSCLTWVNILSKIIFMNYDPLTGPTPPCACLTWFVLLIKHPLSTWEPFILLKLNCIRGGFHGTQHLVFRLSHFNAAIFWADNFCNCLNSSCASFGEKKKWGPPCRFRAN